MIQATSIPIQLLYSRIGNLEWQGTNNILKVGKTFFFRFRPCKPSDTPRLEIIATPVLQRWPTQLVSTAQGGKKR